MLWVDKIFTLAHIQSTKLLCLQVIPKQLIKINSAINYLKKMLLWGKFFINCFILKPPYIHCTMYIGPIQTCVYVLINDNIGVNVSLYKNSSIFWLSKSTVCIISCHTCRSRNCWLFMAMLCCISLQQCFFL